MIQAVTGFLVSLLVWSGVFLLAALATGLAVQRWCARRMRHAPAGRRWLLRAWIAAMVFAAPAGISLFQAVPFVVARELAELVQRSAPEAAKWMTDLASDQVADLLQIEHDDTMVDASDLKARAAAAAADLVSSRQGLTTLAWIQNVAVEKSLRAIVSAIDQVSPADGRLRWRDVVSHTQTLGAIGSSAVAADLVSSLRLLAWTQVGQAVAFVALCHWLTVALFWYIFRPTGASSSGAPGELEARLRQP
jgi:hypothetical protein